jgi:hypothetical protein
MKMTRRQIYDLVHARVSRLKGYPNIESAPKIEASAEVLSKIEQANARRFKNGRK